MSVFLGITREHVFSPGRVEDDSVILRLVAGELQRADHDVTVINGDDVQWPEPTHGTVVFAMCQGARALERLQRWAARGVRIVNHPDGILNCQRHRTVPALIEARTPFPDSVLVETTAPPLLPPWIAECGAWVKRGDVHATASDDVVFVNTADAAHAALRRFEARRVPRAVLQRHVPGTVVKFYAVRRRFFHSVPPPGSHTLSADTVRRIAALGQDAARVLNVEVYGGDCVCGVNDALTLIDLNDWPSYAPCRSEAARAIAGHLLAPPTARDR